MLDLTDPSKKYRCLCEWLSVAKEKAWRLFAGRWNQAEAGRGKNDSEQKMIWSIRSGKRKRLVILAAFMLGGLVLRLVNCFWGYPYQLHPDEPTIVESAVDLIHRRSYEAAVYNRPDHFEIKCCAVLFQLVSYLLYGCSADLSFEMHQTAFYLTARGFTVLWGTLMIPLGYMLSEKIREGGGLPVSGLVTFHPYFIKHSAYSTPDIVLTFFVMLLAYFSWAYYKKPDSKKLTLMCLITAVGITIKYTCAICLIQIALLVIMKDWGRPASVIRKGFYALAIILAACFFLAPNLFTNIEETIRTLKFEARSVHPGFDGLGFGGNVWYYINTFFQGTGWEALPFLVAGISITLIRKKGVLTFPGVTFLICTSALALHHERWGLPVYIFLLIWIGLGMAEMMESGHKGVRGISIILSIIVGINILGLTALQTKVNLTMDSRVEAKAFCDKMGITQENTLYDGYSPLEMKNPKEIEIRLDEEGKLIWPEKTSYLVISSDMYGRYYADQQRFSQQILKYEEIKRQKRILGLGGEVNNEHKSFAVENAVNLWGLTKEGLGGPFLEIFERLE